MHYPTPGCTKTYDRQYINGHVEPAERGDPLVDRLPHRVGIGGVSLVGV
jgi:hypothetical protein